MKQFILTTILIFCITGVQLNAQVNTTLNYSSHYTNNDTRFQPGLLGYDYSNVQVGLFNTYSYVANTSLTYGAILELFNSEQVTQQMVTEFAENLGDVNLIGFGFHIQPISFTYKISTESKEILTFSLSTSAGIKSNAQYGKNIFLLTSGTHQFKDEGEFNLGPFLFHAMAYQYYNLGFAVPIPLALENLKFRGGINLRYIKSQVGLYTERGDALMTVAPDARSWDFDFDYRYNRAMPEFEEGEEVNFKELMFGSDASGTGLGIDVGVSVWYNENISASLNFVDLGYVKYDNNVKNFENRDSTKYQGVRVIILGRRYEDPVETHFSEEIFTPEETEDAFNMPLGGKMVLSGSYSLGELFEENHYKHYRSNFYFTYMQGFNNILSATKRPLISLGYGHNFNKTLNLVGSLAFGGYNKVAIGTFASVRAGFFRFGIGSNNVTGFIMPDNATGVDFSINTNLAF